MANNKQTKNNSDKDIILNLKIGGYDIRVINGKEWIVPFDENKKTEPALDPASPSFDIEKYNTVIAAHEKAYKKNLKGIKEGVYDELKDIYSSEKIDSIAELITTMLQPFFEGYSKAVNGTIDALSNSLLAEASTNILSQLLNKNLLEDIQIYSLILKELKEKFNGRSVEDLTAEELENLENAVVAAAELKELHSITVKKGIESLDYPLDKINSNVWNLLKDADPNGQYTFAVEKKGTSKQADITYSINFEELTNNLIITKKLTAFDKRVYVASHALWQTGYNVFTISQIYGAMGNKGRPDAKAIKKINDSLTKMRAAIISVDNNSEHELYPNYDKFIYDGQLFPMERVSGIVNGQRAEGLIHLFRELPLMTFAKERKQVTTISRKLLESPISKTDANLQIDDYLIEQIAHMKKQQINNKMLYSTIYEKTGITTKMERSRAPEKIRRYLEYYKECGFIKGYKETSDGVIIEY